MSTDPRIPRESNPVATARGLAATVAWTLLALFLANLVAGAYLQRYGRNEGFQLIREKWRLLFERKEPVDWLILGDSSGNQGIDPAVFRERNQGSALNLCTIGELLALNDAWMLESWLEHADPPRKGVVITHVYDVWHRGVNASVLGKVPLPWGYWEDRRPELDLSGTQVWQLFVARYLPLYAENLSLIAALGAGRDAFERHPPVDADGFKAEVLPNEAAVEKDARGHEAFVAKSRFRMSKVNEQALRRILALAEERDFDVYVVNGPLYEGLLRDPRFHAYYEDVVEKLDALTAGHRRAHYLLREPMTFPAEELVNADHLTAAGARRFTARVLEEIADSQGGVVADPG